MTTPIHSLFDQMFPNHPLKHPRVPEDAPMEPASKKGKAYNLVENEPFEHIKIPPTFIPLVKNQIPPPSAPPVPSSIQNLLNDAHLYFKMELYKLAFETTQKTLIIDPVLGAKFCGQFCDWLHFSETAEAFYAKAAAQGDPEMLEKSQLTVKRKEQSIYLTNKLIKKLKKNDCTNIEPLFNRAKTLDPFNFYLLEVESLFQQKVMKNTSESTELFLQFEQLEKITENARQELLNSFPEIQFQ